MRDKNNSKQQLAATTEWRVSSGETEINLTASDLVMAWARDKDTHEPRYILELKQHQQGAKCNCVCVSCGLPLQAVNAAKLEYKLRPHFRHPAGAERDSCLVLSARYAISQQLLADDYIELPRRRKSASIAGLSGQYHEAWVELPPERVRITESKFQDHARALLTLDDGRQLLVELTGSLEVQGELRDTLVPTISLNVSDPTIAAMSREELRQRLTLLWTGACWQSHWQDAELSEAATDAARQMAKNALDWLEDDGEIQGTKWLTGDQRRETLLHKEVKAILQREKRINLPELTVRVEKAAPSRQSFVKTRTWPAEVVILEEVRLEKGLGRVIPDVIAKAATKINGGYDDQLLIEITVTNPINFERLERIREVNLPTLEIDIGRMGGVVTREELVKLVVDELAAKRWVHHPKKVSEENRLNLEIDSEVFAYIEREQRKALSLKVAAQEWGARYLEAISRHGNLREVPSPEHDREAVQKALDDVEDCAHALSQHGYPEAKNRELFLQRGNIIERLLSVKNDIGVGYRLETGWQVINAILQETERYWSWHTLYLIAIKQYQPKLNEKQAAKVEEWRERVMTSIKQGNTLCLRSTVYDELLGFLFPEMQEPLSNGFGRKITNEVPQRRHNEQVVYKDTGKNDLWLKGRDLDEWKQRNPEAAEWFFKNH